jgi:hypothetical protein
MLPFYGSREPARESESEKSGEFQLGQARIAAIFPHF